MPMLLAMQGLSNEQGIIRNEQGVFINEWNWGKEKRVNKILQGGSVL
jgi:hypothetical protein